jgi:transcriptional regulator, ArsR family
MVRLRYADIKTFKLVARDVVELMVEYDKDLRKVLIWLLGGSRGGEMRLRILLLLKKRPMNPNQLARLLNVNYRTVIHHLDVLERNGLVVRMSRDYGAPYFISEMLEKNWDVLKNVVRILGLNEVGEG